MSDFAFISGPSIIGEAESILSRTRVALAPAKPVLSILDRIDPLANLATIGCKTLQDFRVAGRSPFASPVVASS